MTSDGRPYARFRRALEVRSVMGAETAAREMGRPGLNDALDYLVLVATEAPDRYDRAARKSQALLLDPEPIHHQRRGQTLAMAPTESRARCRPGRRCRRLRSEGGRHRGRRHARRPWTGGS